MLFTVIIMVVIEALNTVTEGRHPLITNAAATTGLAQDRIHHVSNMRMQFFFLFFII